MPSRRCLALASRVHFLSWDSAHFAPPVVYLHAGETAIEALAYRKRLRGYWRMTLIAEERECAEQLARFFPQLPAVRIPVRVTPLRLGQPRAQEVTVVEFGSQAYAIFLSKLALEFDDRVRLVRDAGGHPAEAAVIALQYHHGRKAVAVRFLDSPCEWMANRE
jgi:hypothetical protein